MYSGKQGRIGRNWKRYSIYSKNEGDSLKLRAAEFLILNMPGKYSQYSEGQWNDAATVYYRWENLLNRPSALDEYDLSDPVRKDDLKYITADFLINNIELAFKVWREMPWGKDIPFDVFCEEILPYRVGHPINSWCWMNTDWAKKSANTICCISQEII